MPHTSQENAMTEIALALAMGFFSIMVLSMVSMSVAKMPDAKPVQAIALAPASGSKAAAGTVKPKPEDLVLIFDRGRYLDTQLNPVDPVTIDPARRTILAIDPSLPLKQVLAARSAINHPGLVISTLDDRWRTALANRNRGEK